MHSLTIIFGPAATAWTLLFKEEATAGEAYNAYVDYKMQADAEGGVLIGSDDFGQAYAIPFKEIRGVMIEDMELSQLAQIERGVHQARSQAKAQSRAMEDPVIKESIRRQQMGPAVYQPGMPNGRGMM